MKGKADHIGQQIEEALQMLSTPERAVQMPRYFKTGKESMEKEISSMVFLFRISEVWQKNFIKRFRWKSFRMY